MAVDNTTIGSVLTIPSDLIDNLEKVDAKIKKIQESSRATAATFNTQFAGMTSNTNFLINNLDRIIGQLGTIGGAAQTASQATQGMGQGMGAASQGATNFGNSITSVIQAINQMIGQLQQTGQIGTSSLMAAKLAADKLMEAMQYKNNGSIALIKEEISGIDKQLKDTTNLLTKAQQDALVERKRLLQEELKEAERTQNERAVNLQKVLDRMAAAEERYQKKIQQSYKKTAEEYKAQNYAKNTTYQGALDFADNANSINRRLKAIEYLREARAKLNVKEDEYAKKLADINATIKRLDKANRDAVQSSKNLGTAYESLTKHHRNLLDTAGQLQRAFALMFSVSQIRGYISQIAKVRGEFELQQRSLEAILQNKTTADTIFNKTVALAVHSPFQIKDLISYTKQLAAYRIESDKLYDTTKRLADVSAGLGVDMQRLILAYGQVKAAAYLRGTEVRQFTEAGINLYGELQAYFKEVKGEAYTTAQIVDMISKRIVTFEDVEAIFKRITDQGGIFYDMQAIQAETLQGKIANLKDSIDIMLNDIGKANEGSFKGAIDGANTLLRNWESIAEVGKRVFEILLLLKLQSIKTGVAMSSAIVGGTNLAAFTKAREGLNGLSVAFLRLGNYAKSAGLMLKSAFMSNIWILAAMEAVTAIYKIIEGYNQFNEARVKAVSEFNKEIYSLKELKAAYSNVGSESAKSSKTELKNISDKRKALEELVGKMSKEGLKVNFKVDALADNELEKYFNSSLQRYQQFLSDKLKLDILYEKNKRDTYIVDNVEDDLKDYSTAAADLIAESDKVDTAIANLSAKYNQLPKEAKAAFDELANMQGDNTDLDYIQKRIEKLNEIRWYITEYKPAAGGGAYSVGSEAFKDEYNQLVELSKLAKRYIEQKKELLVVQKKDGKYLYEGELANLAAELQNQFARSVQQGVKDGLTKKEAMKQAALDVDLKIKTLQANKQIDDFGADLLRKSGDFKVYFNIDKPNAQRQIDLLDDMIQKTIGDKTYKLRFAVSKTFFDELIDSIDDAGKIVDAKKKWEDVINSGGKITWGYATEKDSSFETWYRNTYRPGWKNKVISDRMELTKLTLTEYAKYRQELAKTTLDAYGVKSKGEEKADEAAAKAQRDLLRERIDAYKELQSQYEKYLKMYDKDTAKTKALESLKYKLQNAGIYGDAVGIFPDEKTIAEKIKGLAAQYKELSKRGDAYKIFADLLLQIDQEKLKKELDAAKEEIDDAFSGLNVYTDLKKLGLSESDIANMFGELPKTFDDVQKKINEIYNGKEGTEWVEKRKEAEKKLQEQIIKYNLDTFKELTKAYGKQLDEQLQLDNWYFEERRKIQDNEQLKKDPDLREQYLANLNKQYEKKTQENMWSQFKGSEMYVHLFENLDNASSFMLNNMLIRLKELKASMKQLDPTELKQITEHINKIMEQKNARNPFKALVQGIKEAKKATQEFNKLGGKAQYNNLTARQTQLISDISMQNEKVDGMQAEYDTMVRLGQAESEKAKLLKQQIADETEILKYNKNQLVVVNGQVMKMEELLILKDNAENKTAQAIQSIVDITTATAQGIESIFNAIGKGDETLSNAIGAFESIGTIVASIYSKNYAGIISGVAGLVTNLISMFNGDKARQKQIEDQQRSVEQLQRAYDKLTESINNSFNATDLEMDTNEAIENLRKTNNALYNMIALENDKKDTNQDQIQDWMNQIEDNREKMEELIRQQTEEMGGFGDKANYKSAAQEFADAWMDAYNSSSNTLEALQDKMDDYFDNLLKKQLMQRAAGKYFEAVFKAFDDAVAEGSAGGANGLEVTREELDKIKEIAATQSGLFDEYAKGLMEVLGVSPQSSTTLSQLQQGIQSLSESTGQALESLLNSIRFFVAQQSTDVAAIRQLLSATSNIEVSNSDNSPMLRELQTQTSYLSKMYSLWSSVIKSGGHPKNGAGIKVFQD